MEVKIHIETECPVAKQTLDLNVNLENVECIGDLKKKLQPLLSVAACDMSVYYKKQTPARKLEDRELISTLYVREGDTFMVQFISVCNIRLLSEFLDNMRSFVTEVCEFEAFSCEGELVMDIFNVTNVYRNKVDNRYRSVIRGLETCSYDLFLPWSNKPTNANRHYFAQEGGLEILANIYNFASKKRYRSTGENDERVLRYFNNKQSELELFCLLCIWNFSETKESRLLVLKKIGLEPFIHSLLKATPDDVDGNQDLNLIRISEGAVGCLAQYVELSDIQQIFVQNKEALLKLLWLTSNGSDNYQKEVAANTVYCCSNHPKAAAKIIENHCYHMVLEKAQKFNLAKDDDHSSCTSAVAYFFCLFLANIQTLPEENLLTNEERENIDQVLENFLRLVNPTEIGEFQKQHNYVWITLIPFMQLALSGPRRRSKTEENEGLQSHPQVSRSSQSETESTCPKTSRIEQTQLSHRMPYIFSPAGKLGLFCLCHLTNTQENRELLRKEKLIDYLICVRWFAQRCPEVEELTPKLDGFKQFEPPRLESIAKAYLSKCFGLKIM